MLARKISTIVSVCLIFLMLFSLSHLRSKTYGMPPHPDLLQKIRDGKIKPPDFLLYPERYRERGIDSPVIHPKGKVYPKGTGPVGNFKALLLLVNFTDNPSYTTGGFFDTLLFVDQPRTVRNYYKEVSYQKLDIVTLNLPSSLGWYNAPQTYAYYVNNQYGFGGYPQNAQKLVEDLVNLADPYVDFSQYDNDGDGYVDALMVAHTGPGAELTSDTTDIWSHTWSLTYPRLKDGVYVFSYTIQPEYWLRPYDMTAGVYCHELGHLFGLPDLYDYDYDSRGVGDWSLMASGSWNGRLGEYPAHPDAWSRLTLGFADPIVVSTDLNGINFPAVEDTSIIYKLWTDGFPGSQYFLVENRQRTGFDAYLDGDGLLIWHIDETVSGNNYQWYPGYTDLGHYQVALEQADGLWEMEKNVNVGDGDDPFPGGTNQRSFTLYTVPNSYDYNFFDTYVEVTNISNSASVMTADLKVLSSTSLETAWVKRYNGPGNSWDKAEAMALDNYGNVYVTGFSSGIATDYDYTTIKYYPNGDTAWLRKYGGPIPFLTRIDEARAIVVDKSGNVYVTGYSEGVLTSRDYATIKYDPSGNTLWVKRYNGPGNGDDLALAIAVDASGNVYVTGVSTGSGTSGDYATVKYDPQGNELWVSRYNGPGNSVDLAGHIAVDGSGNVYVTGSSEGSGTSYDYATIMYYPNGDTAWVRRLDGLGHGGDQPSAVAVDGSGNVYVTGASERPGTEYDYATMKYDSQGNLLWGRGYNGPGNGQDWSYALALDNLGNVYVTGSSEDSGTSYDYATIKYDSQGKQLWVQRYNGPGNGIDEARAIAVDVSGNVYVTGESDGSGTFYDYAIVKYDPQGNQVWVRRYNGPGNNDDWASAIAIDAFGNVYVTGESRGSGTASDYATVKYVQTPTVVKDETGNKERPSAFTLSQNYPNPFNQSTKIKFTLHNSGFVNLSIYNILGRKVKTLVSENLSPGYKSVVWDGKDDFGKEVGSGIYFYRLKVGDFSEAKKLVLLK